MKSIPRLSRSVSAFTIVEMIAVIAIIAIVVGLLVPALSLVQNMAGEVSQKAQFASILMGLETFREEIGDYPDSVRDTLTGYHGAQRLAEAMVGLDGFGFHAASGWDGDLDPATSPYVNATINNRKGPYLELDTANAVKLNNIYGPLTVASDFVNGDTFVLVDKFKTAKNMTTNKKSGMPILYFKANTLPADPDYYRLPNPPTFADYAYVYWDNKPLLDLGIPADSSEIHPMAGTSGGALFYGATANPNYTSPAIPHNNESFILLSAGLDGLYGTSDDIYNFEK